MSKENVMKFDEKVMKDEELQKKLEAAAKAYEGDRTDEKAVFEAVIIPIAREAGLEFSFEEADEVRKMAENGELELSEMQEVAGGSMVGSHHGNFGYIIKMFKQIFG
ncbi:MAG: Nif11-like leader peptide family natural product precursor [Lachnospiraceae bacterium]|nr:Nif11-like leader peptide family natural product precursor [Lachnospiraceae bacterium]